jgi:acyl carrier protein
MNGPADNDFLPRVLAVIARELDRDPAELGPDDAPGRTPGWDSQQHMRIVLALEDSFGVEFSNEMIVQLLSARALADHVRELAEGAAAR